jgi:nitrogen fixation protein FixH
MIRRFTGRHMVIVMVAFFGIIIAVNLVMAHFAFATFNGTIVDNGYVASQQYNHWLARARRQKAMGWDAVITISANHIVTIRVKAPETLAQATSVTAVATHPLGRAPEQRLIFTPVGKGVYTARTPLPPGRWRLHATVKSGAFEARFIEDLTA